MATTWQQVHHQAQRCQRLQDPDAKKQAARLWFALAREAIDATAPAASGALARAISSRPGAR